MSQGFVPFQFVFSSHDVLEQRAPVTHLHELLRGVARQDLLLRAHRLLLAIESLVLELEDHSRDDSSQRGTETEPKPKPVWVGIMMLAWGTVMILMGLVKNFSELAGVRAALGAAEAGFFPAATYLLTIWYKRLELQSRMAVFYSKSMSSCTGNFIMSPSDAKLSQPCPRCRLHFGRILRAPCFRTGTDEGHRRTTRLALDFLH